MDNPSFPKLTHSAKQGELGVNLVTSIITDSFGWLFRRNHQEHDFGIDGQIELVSEVGSVIGQMIATQIKCGPSFFETKNKWGFIYRGESKHFNYLANYPLPVIIIICNPETKVCYWARFDVEKTQETKAGWKLTIPFENVLSTSKLALAELVPQPLDYHASLQSYWAINKVIEEADYLHYVIDNEDIKNKNVCNVRSFFDRLRATKELASLSQGKVEISFWGYDDDPRELFEIEEVRDYIKILDEALPELFFFARTISPTYTLITFALCLTETRWEGERSSYGAPKRVEFNTANVAAFFERHCLGLNEMTEWLNMGIDDNKKITFASANCLGLGFAIPES